MEKKVIRYKGADITVIWQPHLCQHAGICTKTLPKVYNPEARPSVKTEFATTEELISQIDACPSGALTYEYNE